MKKYKSLVVSSLIAAVIISVPFASFAESKDNDKNNENKERVENKKHSEDGNDFKFRFSKENSNSIWNRFAKFMDDDTENISVKSSAPSISDITAPTVLKTGELGTWTVKASDKNNETLSYSVNWGDESNILSRSIAKLAQPTFVQDATFTHTYLKNGKYIIAFTVSNSEGQKTTSKITVQVVGQTVANAPIISNLKATSTKHNKAIISWNTDVKGNSAVWVSKVSSIDTSTKPSTSRKALVLNHKMELKKLEADTTYYVVVKSTNKIGTTTSNEISFKTPSVITDKSLPVITELKGSDTALVGENKIILVNAYDPNNGNLSYSVDWGDSANSISKNETAVSTKPIFVQSATFSHIYNSVGTYTATFTVENNLGKKVSSSMKITVTPVSTDTAKPVISNLKTLTGSTTSTISWTTNEPSTSEVFYSTNTPVDVNSNLTPSIVSKLLVKNHSLDISGLSSGTIYHFVIKSADATSNTTISNESAFMTNFGL